jgi:thioredoxin reductase (NADPH)
MFERVKKNPKIEILTNVVVKDLVGEKGLDHIILENTIDGTNPDLEKLKLDEIDQNRFKLKLDGLFVAIGHDPNTNFVKNLLDTDSAGYLVPQSRLPKEERTSKYDSATKIPGLFVAGDVEDQLYRQAITAAAGGCRAAMETEKWLADQE